MEPIYSMTTLQRNPSQVKEAAKSSVVRITEQGAAAYVFCSEDEFERRIAAEREDAETEILAFAAAGRLRESHRKARTTAASAASTAARATAIAVVVPAETLVGFIVVARLRVAFMHAAIAGTTFVTLVVATALRLVVERKIVAAFELAAGVVVRTARATRARSIQNIRPEIAEIIPELIDIGLLRTAVGIAAVLAALAAIGRTTVALCRTTVRTFGLIGVLGTIVDAAALFVFRRIAFTAPARVIE